MVSLPEEFTGLGSYLDFGLVNLTLGVHGTDLEQMIGAPEGPMDPVELCHAPFDVNVARDVETMNASHLQLGMQKRCEVLSRKPQGNHRKCFRVSRTLQSRFGTAL